MGNLVDRLHRLANMNILIERNVHIRHLLDLLSWCRDNCIPVITCLYNVGRDDELYWGSQRYIRHFAKMPPSRFQKLNGPNPYRMKFIVKDHDAELFKLRCVGS